MRNYLVVIIYILIIMVAISFFVYMLPYILLGGFILWLYFKYIRPLIKGKKEKKTTRNTTKAYKSEEVSSDNQDDLYDGPIIDVDYEEVDTKKKQWDKK